MGKKYYLGLDVGTNSVGMAVTDTNYNLCKYKGEPMWTSHVFDGGEPNDERRGHRTGRRRLNRRQQRVKLTQEIFAKEIAKVDERFFIRLQESALYREDTSGNDAYTMFVDKEYTDIQYYIDYPTIHHLLFELMNSKEKHDVRLVYLAIAWLMAHRGHFLSEVSKNNMEQVLDFDSVYDRFMEEVGDEKPWETDKGEFQRVLLENKKITEKEKLFYELLYDGKKPKDKEEDEISKASIIKLLSGGKVDLSTLFLKKEYAEKISISLHMPQEDFEGILAFLDEEADVIISMKNLYDWAMLKNILAGKKRLSVSEAKVGVYEQHKQDLANLKLFIKKYLPDQYRKIFKEAGTDNYVAYSYQLSSVKDVNQCKKKASKEVFCDYIKKIVKNVQCDAEDMEFYEDMMLRLELYSFMPKQVESDNRVIPYQLYYQELKLILDNCVEYLPFLKETDADGINGVEKLLSIFEFRVPYYVGPLRKDNSEHAWIIRKAKGKIYPWNFEEKVDLDASEQAFIDKMTNTCTYLPSEKVMPKHSLLYCKYMVLNEINNIKINGQPISVECKQEIFELFKRYKKVTRKKIEDYLKSNNYMTKEDQVTGIDITIKASLKSYHEFKRLLEKQLLTEGEVEQVIERLTYSDDKKRVKRWLAEHFSKLSKEDQEYIVKLKYNDFGRLSRKFLSGIKAVNKSTGELLTIMDALWNTNDNLMQILSRGYTFIEVIEEIGEEYYQKYPMNTERMLEEMYVSNTVKRQIYRTLDLVKDVRKVMGSDPDKIFVEMAREKGEEGVRTNSRRSQIQEVYKQFPKEEVRELSLQLEGKSDHELQSETLFLYFMQLGRCMYSGVPLDIEKLKTTIYNVDHIYPQSKVKDDSLSNKVLVLSKINGDKSDEYPINNTIQEKMTPFWKMLLSRKMISEEKYKRLVRVTKFTPEEKRNFIQRQLVETRQSTKAITVLLKKMFPETEIVYVKAGLVSDYRHEFGLVKCRSVNDLHHAKDAYLNIIVGNVYHTKFTSKFFRIDQDYSIKTKTIFKYPVKDGEQIVWNGEQSIAQVKKVLSKNNVHYTRYAFKRKGGLFDQNPLKKSAGLIPRKKGLDTEKYGGYNKSTASFFLLVKYTEVVKKAKDEVMLVPIELMVEKLVLQSEEYAMGYVRCAIAGIINKKEQNVTNISFQLGLRPLKINTVFSFDGYRACLTKKGSGGQKIGCVSMMPLILDTKKEQYMKYLENFAKKKAKDTQYGIIAEYDKITKEENMEYYQFFMRKLNENPYRKAFYSQYKCMQNGKEKFYELTVEDQAQVLLEILKLFKTGRTSPCNFLKIGGSLNAGVYEYSSKISNWKKNYTDVRIIDVAPSGFYEKVSSGNLLELL